MPQSFYVPMSHSFSSSITCREAASKARRMLVMIRWSFAELSVSTFASLYNTPVRHHLESALQAYTLNLFADADCLKKTQWLVRRLVSTVCHMRNENVGWVCTPYTGVDSVEKLVAVYKLFSEG